MLLSWHLLAAGSPWTPLAVDAAFLPLSLFSSSHSLLCVSLKPLYPFTKIPQDLESTVNPGGFHLEINTS